MSAQLVKQSLSKAVLMARRFGTIKSIICVAFVAGSWGWAWGIPQLERQVAEQQAAADRARSALQAAPVLPAVAERTPDEERLALFYDNLGSRRHQEQQIKTLFTVAAQHGLTLNQAEYKPSFDKQGRFHTYQITLPVKAQYSAVRRFSEQALLTIPFASLDEISFKRESIGTRVLEAKLRFTLYVGDEAVRPGEGQNLRRMGNE